MRTTNITNDDRQPGSEKLPAATSGDKICHPSVCVGGAKASNCICPTTKK